MHDTAVVFSINIMKNNELFSFFLGSVFAIGIGILFASGVVEIVQKERILSLSFLNPLRSTNTTIAPEKLAPEIRAQVTAESFLVASLSTGRIISAENSKEILPIASLTKLVTAVVALDVMPSARVTILAEDVREEGNSGKLVKGETFTTKELLYPLLMVSSNDAGAALARTYGRAQFVAKMNAFAWSIGAINTAFADPTGLSYNNVSTTEDMVKIISWIEKNRPDILDITLQKTKSIRTHTWTNSIPFLNMSEYAGGKNGFTDEAQRTSVSLFSYPELGKDFEKVAIVVLKSADRNKDTLALLHSLIVK